MENRVFSAQANSNLNIILNEIEHRVKKIEDLLASTFAIRVKMVAATCFLALATAYSIRNNVHIIARVIVATVTAISTILTAGLLYGTHQLKKIENWKNLIQLFKDKKYEQAYDLFHDKFFQSKMVIWVKRSFSLDLDEEFYKDFEKDLKCNFLSDYSFSSTDFLKQLAAVEVANKFQLAIWNSLVSSEIKLDSVYKFTGVLYTISSIYKHFEARSIAHLENNAKFISHVFKTSDSLQNVDMPDGNLLDHIKSHHYLPKR